MAEAVLVAGRDYPRSYHEFVEMFPDSAACAAYLEGLRWPEGIVCPRCGVVGEPWRQTRGRLVCRACRYQTSVTSGTVFDKTRVPVTTWFEEPEVAYGSGWYGHNILGQEELTD